MWKQIIKVDKAGLSLGSKVTSKVSQRKLPTQKYIISLTQKYSGSLFGRWTPMWANKKIHKFDTRKEAKIFLIKEMRRLADPAPWTVEGDDVSGHCVVYDGQGIMMSAVAPSYYYLIHEEDEKLPDALTFNPQVDYTSPNAMRNRMEGKPFGSE